jgi:hypothetical protein
MRGFKLRFQRFNDRKYVDADSLLQFRRSRTRDYKHAANDDVWSEWSEGWQKEQQERKKNGYPMPRAGFELASLPNTCTRCRRLIPAWQHGRAAS